tara:strand:- start:149124 stop:149267 length:144 start_codon:yes stop_codon:yes gene_type:complete
MTGKAEGKDRRHMRLSKVFRGVVWRVDFAVQDLGGAEIDLATQETQA